MDKRAEYVAEREAESEDGASESGMRPMIAHRVKQALVTSRLTLGAQSTGGDPYDSRQSPSPGAVWRDRTR